MSPSPFAARRNAASDSTKRAGQRPAHAVSSAANFPLAPARKVRQSRPAIVVRIEAAIKS
jgi:hypothetical protein